MDLLVGCIQLYVMLDQFKFSAVFSMTYILLWFSLPGINLMFLVGSNQAKFNLLNANLWGLWFIMAAHIALMWLNWELFNGEFSKNFHLNSNQLSIGICLLQNMVYFAQGALFVVYGYYVKADMNIEGSTA